MSERPYSCYEIMLSKSNSSERHDQIVADAYSKFAHTKSSVQGGFMEPQDGAPYFNQQSLQLTFHSHHRSARDEAGRLVYPSAPLHIETRRDEAGRLFSVAAPIKDPTPRDEAGRPLQPPAPPRDRMQRDEAGRLLSQPATLMDRTPRDEASRELYLSSPFDQ